MTERSFPSCQTSKLITVHLYAVYSSVTIALVQPNKGEGKQWREMSPDRSFKSNICLPDNTKKATFHVHVPRECIYNYVLKLNLPSPPLPLLVLSCLSPFPPFFFQFSLQPVLDRTWGQPTPRYPRAGHSLPFPRSPARLDETFVFSRLPQRQSVV